MKIHIPVCVAIALAFMSTTAYGQYAQQRSTAQQHWGVPIVQASSSQEPALTVQSNAAPAPMQGAYNSVVGSDCGCASDCGGQCDRGGRLRNRLFSGGQGDDCNTCGPERYLTIFGGAVSFNDIGFNNITRDATGAVVADNSLIVKENNGWTVGGGIGQRLSRRIRGEVEWSYRNASLEGTGSPVTTPLDGQLNMYRSTSNLFFDVNPEGRFNLYFGGGVGVGFIDLDATDPAIPMGTRLKTSAFAYQGVVGVSAKVKPKVEMFVDYRYSGTSQLELDTITPAGSTDFDVDVTSNDIFVGLRFKR